MEPVVADRAPQGTNGSPKRNSPAHDADPRTTTRRGWNGVPNDAIAERSIDAGPACHVFSPYCTTIPPATIRTPPRSVDGAGRSPMNATAIAWLTAKKTVM